MQGFTDRHIYTSILQVELTFATVRLRTNLTRNSVSRVTILSMVFKLTQRVGKRCRKLRGFRLPADVIDSMKFVDGIKQESENQDNENRDVA